MQKLGTRLVLGLVGLAVLGGGIAIETGRFEVPAPRYAEASDYPVIVAKSLEAQFAADPQLNRLKVLRSWGWRWGRYDASIQVWGTMDANIELKILALVKATKQDTPPHRTIELELVENLMPGEPANSPDYKDRKFII